MEMEHSFTVPAQVETVWEALLDLERVVGCMPGASLNSHDGDEFVGTVKVKVGVISLQYKGSGRFTERDEAAGRAVIAASGREARGNGTATATVTARLAQDGPGTAVTVVTDLSVTGRPAQFGRGLISDVAGKIIGQFADCLADELGTEESAPVTPSASEQPEAADTWQPAVSSDGQARAITPRPATPSPATPTPVRPAPAPVSEEINLLDSAGMPVLKRVAPVVAGMTVLFILIRRLKHHRSR